MGAALEQLSQGSGNATGSLHGPQKSLNPFGKMQEGVREMRFLKAKKAVIFYLG